MVHRLQSEDHLQEQTWPLLVTNKVYNKAVNSRFIVIPILIILAIATGFWLYGKRPPATPKAISAPSPRPQEQALTFNLTLNRIFQTDHSWTASLSGNPRVRTMLVTGDIIPARMVNVKTTSVNDFVLPYKKTIDLLRPADIRFGNLEAPLMDACKVSREGMVFCGTSKHIEGLTYASIDIVNLANNHAGNYQEAGVEETIRHLTQAGIAHTGTGSATVMNVKGQKWAFLGFSDISGTCCGLQTADIPAIQVQVRQAKKQAELVIVQFHWGTEYKEDPDLRARQLGKATIDAGADLVIGNHPHWVQGVEFYKGKLITYAHGNYIFDQMWSTETRQGVLGKYTFYDNQLIDVEYFPIMIDDFVQPRPAKADEAKTILDRMIRSSNKLAQ